MADNAKRISILGTGWLGQPLAQQLKQQSFELKLATRSNERLAQLAQFSANNYQVDLDSLKNNKNITSFLEADILIINVTHKIKQNFEQLIEHIEQSPIKYVLFISSTSVYQNTQSIVTEAEEFEDKNNVLLQIEHLFNASTHFKTSYIRFAGLVDARRHPGRFFKSGKIVPQAEAPINLIHLDDCLGVINAIIEQSAWGEVFNACSTTHPTKRLFYTYARSLLSDSPPEFSDNDTLSYKIVSNEKIQQQLNYQFIHPDLMHTSFT